MFGTESTDNLYFSVSASQLGNGLDEQLARFVAEHKGNPDAGKALTFRPAVRYTGLQSGL